MYKCETIFSVSSQTWSKNTELEVSAVAIVDIRTVSIVAMKV